jgi:hypothetical protein
MKASVAAVCLHMCTPRGTPAWQLAAGDTAAVLAALSSLQPR